MDFSLKNQLINILNKSIINQSKKKMYEDYNDEEERLGEIVS